MTITPKFRAIAFTASIVSMLVFIAVGIYRINFRSHHDIVYDVIYVISQLTYLIAIFYLTELLKYAGERKFIVAGFYVYALLTLITSIIGYASFSPMIMINIVVVLNILSALVYIYLIIASFSIRNPVLTYSFRVFAIVQLFMLMLNFGVTLLLAYLNPAFYFKISRYMHFSGLIITCAIAYIIYVSGKLLKTPDALAPEPAP